MMLIGDSIIFKPRIM